MQPYYIRFRHESIMSGNRLIEENKRLVRMLMYRLQGMIIEEIEGYAILVLIPDEYVPRLADLEGPYGCEFQPRKR